MSLRYEAIEFVKKLMEAPIDKICIENPVSVISSYIRKSDQMINPYQFGHTEYKRTCLWLKGLPPLFLPGMMEKPNYLYKDKSGKRWHFVDSVSSGERQSSIRNTTFLGIAKAMAEQWGGSKCLP